MLENLALDYAEMPGLAIWAISYACIIIGGLIGGLTSRSTAEIKRAPHFALTGMILFCISCTSFVTMGIVVASLAGGYYWAVTGMTFVVMAIGGFFFARIAIARARDAFGNGALGALSFIPLANLWLLGAPTKNPASGNRVTFLPILHGALGVCVGLLLTGASRLIDTYTGREATRRVETAAAAGAFDVAMLDRTLASMVAQMQTPMPIDETTTILRAEAIGHELRLIYQVSLDQPFITDAKRFDLVKSTCTDPGMTGVIAAGATISFVYLQKNGAELDRVQVARADCTT